MYICIYFGILQEQDNPVPSERIGVTIYSSERFRCLSMFSLITYIRKLFKCPHKKCLVILRG